MKGIHVFIENLGSLLPYLFPPKNNAKDTIPCYQIPQDLPQSGSEKKKKYPILYMLPYHQQKEPG